MTLLTMRAGRLEVDLAPRAGGSIVRFSVDGRLRRAAPTAGDNCCAGDGRSRGNEQRAIRCCPSPIALPADASSSTDARSICGAIGHKRGASHARRRLGRGVDAAPRSAVGEIAYDHAADATAAGRSPIAPAKSIASTSDRLTVRISLGESRHARRAGGDRLAPILRPRRRRPSSGAARAACHSRMPRSRRPSVSPSGGMGFQRRPSPRRRRAGQRFEGWDGGPSPGPNRGWCSRCRPAGRSGRW